MSIQELLNVALGLVATVATIAATYLAWKQYRRPNPERVVTLGEKVTAYLSRPETVNAFAEMLRRAPDGAAVFCQCKTCADYPSSFYQALLDSSARGMSFRFIVSPSADAREFARYLRNIQGMSIRFKEIEYARLLGVEGKEAITVIIGPVSYVGIHVRDPVAARHQQIAFEVEWKSSKSGSSLT